MSKQVRFLVAKDDLNELLRFADQKGFRAIPEVIESDSLPVARCPIDAKIPLNAEFFYLLPEQFAAVEAFYKELPHEPGLSKLLARSSPVIEVSPVVIPSNGRFEGRIYICQDSNDPRFVVAMKAFDTLADFLSKWQRSSDGRLRIGPCAAMMCGEDS